ncbi:MAG: rhomboid family intramembrane serine protease [Planctomycetes bacterium]|nr:rhomboid family intramembrane serine protease [Planctomycetota bacterium]
MSYDGPRLHFPALTPAIRFLLLANCAVFLANMVLVGQLSDPGRGGGGFLFACSWRGLWEGYGSGLLRLVTYQFTHSFRDPMHLAMNMVVLYFFGTMAEQRLGMRGTLRLYLAGGLAGAMLHLALAAAQGHADVPLVGASGACYAFLLYATCMAPRSIVFLVFVPVPLWGLAAFLVAMGLYSTFVELTTGFVDRVAHGAHLGGAALGAIAHRAGWFVDWRRQAGGGGSWLGGWRARLQAVRAQRHQRAAQQHELQLDEILAKVKQHGIASLTGAERRFLERSSRHSRGDRR